MLSDFAIIAFTGKAGAGKTTAATYVANSLSSKNKRAKKAAFADPLKKLCCDVYSVAFGVPKTAFYGSQDAKNRELVSLPGWSGRKILQHIGTEGFRHVSPGVWANYAINYAQLSLKMDNYDHVILDDLRFISEADAVRKAGGIVVGIQGGHANQGGAAQGIPGHVSETETALVVPDRILINDGTLEEFHTKLEKRL